MTAGATPKRFRMYVYVNGKLTIVETNPDCIVFWGHRKRIRAMDGVRVTWKIEGPVPERRAKDPAWLSAYN